MIEGQTWESPGGHRQPVQGHDKHENKHQEFNYGNIYRITGWNWRGYKDTMEKGRPSYFMHKRYLKPVLECPKIGWVFFVSSHFHLKHACDCGVLLCVIITINSDRENVPKHLAAFFEGHRITWAQKNVKPVPFQLSMLFSAVLLSSKVILLWHMSWKPASFSPRVLCSRFLMLSWQAIFQTFLV